MGFIGRGFVGGICWEGLSGGVVGGVFVGGVV